MTENKTRNHSRNEWLNGYSIYWNIEIFTKVQFPRPGISGREFLTWLYYTARADNLKGWKYTGPDSQNLLQQRYTRETNKSVSFTQKWRQDAAKVNNPWIIWRPAPMKPPQKSPMKPPQKSPMKPPQKSSMKPPQKSPMEPPQSPMKPAREPMKPPQGIVKPNQGLVKPNQGLVKPTQGIVKPNQGLVEPTDNFTSVTNSMDYHQYTDRTALSALIKHLVVRLLSPFGCKQIVDEDYFLSISKRHITEIRRPYPFWECLLDKLAKIYPYNHPVWGDMYDSISHASPYASPYVPRINILQELLNFWKFKNQEEPSAHQINLFLENEKVRDMIKAEFKWIPYPSFFQMKNCEEKSDIKATVALLNFEYPVVPITDQEYKQGRFGDYLFDFTQRPLTTESFGAVWVDKTKEYMLKSNGHLFQDPTEESWKNSMKEISILKKCNHNNIIKFYGAYACTNNTGKANSMPETWLVMENADYTLYDAIWYDRDNKGLPEARAKNFTNQLRQAIKYLKDQHFIYRAIKPTNIIYKKNAFGQEVVKLTDFGLATKNSFSNKFDATTFKYMAPEELHMFIISGQDSNYSSMLYLAIKIFTHFYVK